MKKLFIVVIMTYSFFCSGCLPIPYHAYLCRMPDEKALASFKEGVTSKEDVLMTLGEPNKVLENERSFLYWWEEEHGTVAVLLPPVGVLPVPIRSLHWLYIQFEENNIMNKCRITKTKKVVVGVGGFGQEHYDKEKDTSLPPPDQEYGCDSSKVP